MYKHDERQMILQTLQVIGHPPFRAASGSPYKGRPAIKKRMDAKIRNRVEAVFGESKCFYGLGRIMSRLKETSETVIAMQLLVIISNESGTQAPDSF